jgi:hypothetical protein
MFGKIVILHHICKLNSIFDKWVTGNYPLLPNNTFINLYRYKIRKCFIGFYSDYRLSINWEIMEKWNIEFIATCYYFFSIIKNYTK